MFTFLKEVRAELGKVTWPGTSDVSRLTITVIVISVIVGLYLGSADFLFTNLLGLLVR
jgi:preprotein translocase subunit SecE